MNRVISFGESLLDIVYQPDKTVYVIPGGSILNASVSLARSGIQVELMTEYAHDGPGKIVLDFLKSENIGVEFSCEYENTKTSLAFAILDESAKASYTFFKEMPVKRFLRQLPEFDSNTLFLFGSFSAINEDLAQTVEDILVKAKHAGSLIYYDPNIRKTATKIDHLTLNKIFRNFSFANIIRGSDEDFEAIFDTSDIHFVWNKLQTPDCKLLIITKGSKSLEVKNDKFHLIYEISTLQIVSTIGAGDSFNAGFISALFHLTELSKMVSFDKKTEIDYCVKNAIRFASVVCESKINYIPKDFV